MNLTSLFYASILMMFIIGLFLLVIWLAKPRKQLDILREDELKPINFDALDKSSFVSKPEINDLSQAVKPKLVEFVESAFENCPFCREQILCGVIKCKHCKSFILRKNFIKSNILILLFISTCFLGLMIWILNSQNIYYDNIFFSTLRFLTAMIVGLIDPISLIGYILSGIYVRNVWLAILASFSWVILWMIIGIFINQGDQGLLIYLPTRLAGALLVTLVSRKLALLRQNPK